MTPINNNQNNINSLEGLEQEFKDFWSEEYGCAACDYSECRDRYEDNILAFLMPKIQSLITTHEQQARREGIEYILKHANSRLKQHTDNLGLWKNGTLTPTEPDEQQRAITIEGLDACIFELNELKKFLEENPSA